MQWDYILTYLIWFKTLFFLTQMFVEKSSGKVSWFSRTNIMFTKIWSHFRGLFEALGRKRISYSFPLQQARIFPALKPSTCGKVKDKIRKSPKRRIFWFPSSQLQIWSLDHLVDLFEGQFLITSNAQTWSILMGNSWTVPFLVAAIFHRGLGSDLQSFVQILYGWKIVSLQWDPKMS